MTKRLDGSPNPRKAWACPHTNRPHAAHGLCSACKVTARRRAKRAERGPSGAHIKEPLPNIPQGHELGGQSTLIGPSGELKGRWDKSRVAGTEPEPLPEGFGAPTRIAQYTRGDGTVIGEWRTYDREREEKRAATIEIIREHVAGLVTPFEPTPAPANANLDLLTCYIWGDPHLGMLAWGKEVGESFDLKIATRELTQCAINLVDRAPPSEEAIITNLGDFFHATTDKQQTPSSGHKLDVDGRFAKVATAGLDLYVGAARYALRKHKRVRLRNVPGNHDFEATFWLAECLRREFRDEPRITVEDAYSPYQFDEWGKVLLGWAHTDGAKPLQLGGVMAADEPEMWGRTRFRFWHGGHVHHLSRTEVAGAVVETHRTLAGKDAWHNWKGYRAGRSLQAITYHKLWGEDSRITEGIERVRATIIGQGKAA